MRLSCEVRYKKVHVTPRRARQQTCTVQMTYCRVEPAGSFRYVAGELGQQSGEEDLKFPSLEGIGGIEVGGDRY